MVIIAVLAVLALVTLIAAYLGSKHWHWAHVLVVVALFFTTLGFTFLAAEVLEVRTRFLKRVEVAEEKIEPVEKMIRAVSRGTTDQELIRRMINEEMAVDEAVLENRGRAPGLVNLRHELQLQNRTLGRVWRDAQPLGRPDPQTGAVSVGIEFPQPLGIAQGAILFAFEQGPANVQNPQQGRQYLGEFRVASVDGQQLSLQPVLKLDEYETRRLAASQGPWSLYETMPLDRHEMFKRYTNDQLRQIMPASSVEEYLRDGTPWTVDDGEWTKEGRDAEGNIVGVEDWDDDTKFVYRRRLRDYAFLFNDLAKERIQLEAKKKALDEDTKKLEAALASAQQINKERLALQQQLNKDLTGVKGDRQAIEAHLAALEQQLERGRRLVDRLRSANAELANRLAARQSALAGFDVEKNPVPAGGAVDIDAL